MEDDAAISGPSLPEAADRIENRMTNNTERKDESGREDSKCAFVQENCDTTVNQIKRDQIDLELVYKREALEKDYVIDRQQSKIARLKSRLLERERELEAHARKILDLEDKVLKVKQEAWYTKYEASMTQVTDLKSAITTWAVMEETAQRLETAEAKCQALEAQIGEQRKD